MKRTTRTTIGDRTRMRLEELETREVPAVVGALDPTFGTAGKVLVNGGPYSAVAVQPDGKIVAVGASTNDFLVVRFNPNGTVDTTFGTGGIQKIDFNGLADAANDVKIQSDGKIVVVGQAATAAHGLDFAIARLNNDGGLDASFGTGGKTTVDFAGGGTNNDVANAVAIAANGNIYVVGTAAGGAGITKFGVAAFSTTGAPLTTFGAAGHEFEDFGGTADAGNGIAIQADGKLVIAGTTNAVPANGTDIAVGRLNPTDGSLDMGFGSSGKVAVNFGGAANDVGNAVAIQPNGDIVVAGASDLNAAGNFDAAAIRLTPTAGALDATFGSGGKATIDFGGNADSANAVVVQPDGNIVIAGNNNADVVVARLLQGN
ncbi:MAG TPA: delta-60 repeat domain-containing protein, partial [Urbifossiella sp.]|nr:delta-60 repeat domain-containing protein [Urbifossiella sp.]